MTMEEDSKKIIAEEYLMRSEVQTLYFRLYSNITKFMCFIYIYIYIYI